MSRVVFVSELGGGFGHLSKLSLLAEPLTQNACEVFAGLTNSGETRLAGKNLPVNFFDLPAWPPPIHRANHALNYAEILARVGYCAPGRLAGALQQWVTILERIRPGLVIGDHAPTALLAARACGIPQARVGTGFQSPPAENPLPALFKESTAQTRKLRAKMDSLVLEAINKAMSSYGVKPASRLHKALRIDHDLICTLPETDHYGQRPKTHYWGPLFTLPTGLKADWPAVTGKRVFVYLNSTTPGLGQLCQALSELDCSALVFVRGISKKQVADLTLANVRVVDTPVDMSAVLESAELIICNGGHGVVSATLLSGRALLVSPLHAEQMMCSNRLSDQGLAATILANSNKQAWREAIRTRLKPDRENDALTEFAQKYKNYDPNRTAEKIAQVLANSIH